MRALHGQRSARECLLSLDGARSWKYQQHSPVRGEREAGLMGIWSHVGEAASTLLGDKESEQRFREKRTGSPETQKAELEAQSHEIFDEVRKLQDQKVKLNPKTDQQSIEAIDKRLTDLQGQFTKLYHPSQNPGALAHLGSFIQDHLGKNKQAAAPPNAQPPLTAAKGPQPSAPAAV